MHIVPVPDPPIITLGPGGSLDFATVFVEGTLGGAPLASPDALIIDTDSADLTLMLLTLSPALDIGEKIELSPPTLGALTEARFGTTVQYQVNPTGGRSLAAFNAVMKALRYVNPAEEPFPNERLVTFLVAAADGAAVVASTRVTVELVNDHTPAFAGLATSVTVTESLRPVSLVVTLQATDLYRGDAGQFAFAIESVQQESHGVRGRICRQLTRVCVLCACVCWDGGVAVVRWKWCHNWGLLSRATPSAFSRWTRAMGNCAYSRWERGAAVQPRQRGSWVAALGPGDRAVSVEAYLPACVVH
jgi:hypothetical protein